MLTSAAITPPSPLKSAALADDPVSAATGVRVRLLVPLTLVIVLMVLAFVTILMVETRNRQTADIARTATAVDHMFKERSRRSVELMQSIMEQLMRNKELELAFRKRDVTALESFSRPVFSDIKARHAITHFYYILPDSTALLRVHSPDLAGDKIDRFTLKEAKRIGKPFWGNEQGIRGTFTLRAIYPWMSNGVLIGYLEMGIEFEDIMQSIRSFLDVDVFVAMDKPLFNRAMWEKSQAGSGLNRSWDEFPSVLLISRTTPVVPPPIRDYLAGLMYKHEAHSFEAAWDDQVAQAVTVPFVDVRGRPMGEIVVVRDITAATSQRHSATFGVAFASVIVGGALLLSFYFLLGRVQRDVAQRTARLGDAQRGLAAEQFERQRAERDLALLHERNDLLETRSRMVEELAAANEAAEAALRAKEQITAELREAQGELLVSARQAGMAEIATSVLHNVGNVLNSVNVSADLVGSTLRTSRGQGLSRAVQLMNEHAADLGDFMANDPKGKMLPAYLDGLAQAMAEERTGMLNELDHLTRNIDHIKAVVSTQQSYTGAAGMIELVELSELAEDALRMNGGSLARHKVNIVRRFEPVPPVRLDRARAMQILVNLISNARNATESMASEERRITLGVEMVDGSRVRVSVTDNGEGIHPENITRIFAHGFTTRKEGHGFGLHSSALAAREMGGSLSAHSDGPGRGATFTLELPLDAGLDAGLGSVQVAGSS